MIRRMNDSGGGDGCCKSMKDRAWSKHCLKHHLNRPSTIYHIHRVYCSSIARRESRPVILIWSPHSSREMTPPSTECAKHEHRSSLTHQLVVPSKLNIIHIRYNAEEVKIQKTYGYSRPPAWLLHHAPLSLPCRSLTCPIKGIMFLSKNENAIWQT